MLNTVIRQLRTLLLAMWLGAAIFFSAAVAPALFKVLRGAGLVNGNELAGSVVSHLLSIVNKGGFEIALFLLVTAFFANKNRRRIAFVAEVLSFAIMTIMTGAGHWIISARMAMLRAAVAVPIDQLAVTDPRRAAFDSLHRYSVIFMSVAMVAGLIGFFVMTSRGAQNPRAPESA